MNIDKTRYIIKPISKILNLEDIRNDYFRSIEIKFANINTLSDGDGSSLNDILKSYNNLGGTAGAFTVTLGRTKKKSLAKEPIRKLIKEITGNKEIISSAILKVKDEDDIEVDVINLFDNVYSILITFSIPPKTALNYEYCVNEMTEKFLYHKESIIKILN